MKISAVSVEHYDRGIPLKGWENVKKALNLHADGATVGSRATHDDLEKNVSSAGGVLGIGLLLMSEMRGGPPSSFVDKILDRASSHLKKNDQWKERYDYDGPGYFHKTTITIDVLDRPQELYKLEIYASYVGDKPEKELAEYLGIPRAVVRYTVTAQVVPHSPKYFAFDFEKILRALDETLETQGLTGVEVANHFMSGDKYRDPRAVKIYSDTDFCVLLGLGRVENRFVYDHENDEHNDTWCVAESMLVGLLDESYEDSNIKEIPSFCLTLVGSKKDRYGDTLSVWDSELKDKMDIKAYAIAEALKKNQFFEI